MSRRTGILGGMFDPIHRGHTDAASAAQAALGLSALFVVPAHIPPHRPQPLASPFHRFAMVALAVAERPGWHASDIELAADGPSFTSATLRAFLQRGYQAADLFFITGADAFAEIETWRDYPALLDLAQFVVVSRPGSPATALSARLPSLAARMTPVVTDAGSSNRTMIFLLNAPTSDVSSTAIRRRCAEGLPIDGMVDAVVAQHIEKHGLYAAGPVAGTPGHEAPYGGAGRLHGHTR